MISTRVAAWSALIISAAPAVGAALIASVGLAFGVIAGLALRSNQQIRDSYLGLWAGVVRDFQADTRILVPSAQRIAGQLGEAFQSVRPQVRNIFRDLGPEVEVLTRGLVSFIKNTMPGFEDAIRSGMPVFEGWANLFARAGTGAGKFFTILSTGSSDLGGTLGMVGGLLEALLPPIAKITNQVAAVFNADGPMIVRVVSQIGDAISGVSGGALPQFSGSIGTILAVVSNLLTVLGPLAPLIGTIAGVFLSGQLYAKVFGAALTGVGAAANGVLGGLGNLATRLDSTSTAGTKLAGAGGAIKASLANAGNYLPILGVAYAGLQSIMADVAGTTQDLTAAISKGGDAAEQARQKLADNDAQLKYLNQDYLNANPIVSGFLGLYKTMVPTTEDVTRAQAEQRAGMSESQRLSQDVTRAQNDYTDAVAKFGQNSPAAMIAAAALTGATQRQTDAQKILNDATKDGTQRLLELQNQQLAMANADVAIRQSKLQVADAQKTYNDAVKAHGPNSREAQDASLALESQYYSYIGAADRKAQADAAGMNSTDAAKLATQRHNDAILTMIQSAGVKAPPELRKLVAGMDDGARAAYNAAVETSGLNYKVVTLSPGKTINIVTDSHATPQQLDEIRNKANSIPTSVVIRVAANISAAANSIASIVQQAGRVAGHAGGGLWRGGTASWVGEKGPELLFSSRDQYVATAEQSRRIVAATSTAATVANSTTPPATTTPAGGGGAQFGDINITLQGIVDLTNPAAMSTAARRFAVQMRDAIRQVERSYA